MTAIKLTENEILALQSSLSLRDSDGLKHFKLKQTPKPLVWLRMRRQYFPKDGELVSINERPNVKILIKTLCDYEQNPGGMQSSNEHI